VAVWLLLQLVLLIPHTLICWGD